MKPNSNIYPSCSSCIFFDPSYQTEGPNYGLCRHSRNVTRSYNDGPPMDLHPITGKTDKACAFYNDGEQPSIFPAPDDQLISRMLTASKLIKEQMGPLYKIR